MFALMLSLALGATPGVSEAADASPSGASGHGIHLEGPVIGPVQAFTTRGSATGLSLGVGVQVDIKPHVAVRVPLDLALKKGSRLYSELSIAPGLRYRWYSDPEQFLVPFAGLGMRLGLGNAADVAAIGEPPGASTVTSGSDVGPSFSFLFSPEVSAGLELRPVSWLGLTLQADYTFVWMNVPTLVHVVRERAGLQVSF